MLQVTIMQCGPDRANNDLLHGRSRGSAKRACRRTAGHAG